MELVTRLDRHTDRDAFLRELFGLGWEDAQQLLRACEADVPTPRNMFLIGLCHLYGKGVPKDEPRGVEWLKKSAEMGNVDAMTHLGDHYHNLHDSGLEDADTASTSVRESIEWYLKATSLGDSYAMWSLGDIHHDDEEYTQAFQWFYRSADLGNPDALCALGECYENGEGVEPDPGKAVELYKRSAGMGSREAMKHLARCYGQGIGVDRNVVEAITWYERVLALESCTDTALELGVLLAETDPRVSLPYYLDAYESSEPGHKKDEHKYQIMTIVRSHDNTVDLLSEWRHVTSEVETLRAENERMRAELDYRPDGPGYTEARAHFADTVALATPKIETLSLS